MGCGLEVTLEPPESVEAGADVTVRVRATSDEPARCEVVRCEAGWTTHGRGERDSDVPFRQGVPGGDMGPGQPLEREFRFTVPPSGPVTYSGLRLSRGSLLAIDWEVRITLEGNWLKDPERAVPLVVVPRSI